MARTFYAENLALLTSIVAGADAVREEEEDGTVDRWFVGTVFALDPCGRFHHAFSPNGAGARCEAYWESLDKAADRLEGYIERGPDPCDVFFQRSVEEGEAVTVEEAVAEGLDALYAGEVEDDEDHLSEQYEDLEPGQCPVCLGPVYPLGTLGARQHFRCRNCGLDLSQPAA